MFLWEDYHISRVNFQLGMAGTFFPNPVHEDHGPVTREKSPAEE